jgi:4-methyl-5(b-hydroxyethyl)-thiazole monophosphate biosynthesis
MKSAFVFLADGFEDVEAVTPVDYLRRAGVSVTVVGITGRTVVSSHQLALSCDRTLTEVLSGPLPDLVVLPGGGKGSENLSESPELEKLVVRMFRENRLVGALCAAPAVVLGGWGLLEGRVWTGYPGNGDNLPVKPLEKRVVIDSNLITARAAGVAEEFTLALVDALCGSVIAAKVADSILSRAT